MIVSIWRSLGCLSASKKINLHFQVFLEILQRYYKLVILGTLGMHGYRVHGSFVNQFLLSIPWFSLVFKYFFLEFRWRKVWFSLIMLKEIFWQLNRCSINIFLSESCKKSGTSIDTNPLKKHSSVPNSGSGKKKNFKNTNNY